MNSTLLAIGRILASILFINGGIAHFTKVGAMTGYAQYKKVPAAKLSVLLSGLVILVGGLFVFFGVWVDLGAILIVLFLLSSGVLFHNFWKETDATAKQNESIAFFKNVAIAGALLIVVGLTYKHGSTVDLGWSISKAHVLLWK